MAQDCAPFGVYSWNNVACQIDGRHLVGLWEGDDVFVIEPTTELGKPVVGADGSSIVSITADQSAKVTVKLMPTSPFNAYLNNKVRKMRAGGLASSITFPIGFLDMSTGESGACTQAIVTKIPDVSKGASATERVWEIFCPCWVPSEVQIGQG